MKKDKTKHKYLVGYVGDGQPVYGKDIEDEFVKVANFAQPMTLLQAERQIKTLSSKAHKVVYELKPVRFKNGS